MSLVRTKAVPERGEVSVEITRLRRRHLRQVMRIEDQVYPRPWTLAIFHGELSLPTQRSYIAARVGHTVVGYCGTMFSETDAHITNIAVDPRWQRHQIATRLMVVAIRRAVVLGSKNLTLEVRHTNESAQAMYRRFGLAPAGVRKRYYENTDDAIVMWAHDIDSDDYSDRLAALWNAVDGPTVLASDVTKDIAPVSDRSES